MRSTQLNGLESNTSCTKSLKKKRQMTWRLIHQELGFRREP